MCQILRRTFSRRKAFVFSITNIAACGITIHPFRRGQMAGLGPQLPVR
jgi:hypothetical protein